MPLHLLLAAICCFFMGTAVRAVEADHTSLPDWKRAILDKTTFELRIMAPSALFPEGSSPKDLSEDAFLLFVCLARSNLGKRLLWVNAGVEFSNGMTRTFKSVSLHLIEGSAAAVAKLDFPAAPGLAVKRLKLTSAELK